jgi:PKD repeat protein
MSDSAPEPTGDKATDGGTEDALASSVLPVERRTYVTLLAASAAAAGEAGAAPSGSASSDGAPTDDSTAGPDSNHNYGQGGYGEGAYGGRDGPPPLPGFQNPPTDPDGDGLYEDVRGDGNFRVFDVQTLFTNLNSDEVQNNSEFYNFQGQNANEVTIFDVQALFTELGS